MALLREGKKNVEIAAIVGCSDKTVSRIKKKMSSEPQGSSGTGTGFVF
jgi:DNA-binding NarL/FixJ family response regulator